MRVCQNKNDLSKKLQIVANRYKKSHINSVLE